MSHAFPLAATLEDALLADVPAARTRADAEALAEGRIISGLVTDWLTLEPDALQSLLATEFKTARGHLQRYEDETGRPVLALTWWKIAPADDKPKRKPGKASKKAAAPAPIEPSPDTPPAEDHTDDLYFRSGRTQKRKAGADPNQLNLFDPPEPS